MKIKLSHTEVEVKLFLEVLGVYAVLAMALVGIYYLEPVITGFVTVTKQFNHTDEIGLDFEGSSDYVWSLENPGNLKSVKISGSMNEEGRARVYIEDEGIRYLIFDSNQLVEKESGIFGITEFVVLGDDQDKIKTDVEGTLNDEQQTFVDLLISDINNTKNNVEIELETDDGGVSRVIKGDVTELQNSLIDSLSLSLENSTGIKIKIEAEFEEQEVTINETIEKTINIDLDYGDNEFYDANNDGIENFEGIIDFTTKDTSFNWDVDESNLCTRYDIYSIENKETTTTCFGNNNCCDFVGLESSRDLWDESLFLGFGGYGSTNNNIIFAQVLNIDYNLSLENAYTDIVYSSWRNKTAEFVSGLIEFEDICVESCVFDGNASSYNLIIELDGIDLKIDSIKYMVEERVTNIDPVLAKEIENINLIENKNYTLDLTEYFFDEDGDELAYWYNDINNVVIRFEDDFAYIIPDDGFVGAEFVFITGSDSFTQVSSNVFKIEVGSEEASLEFLESKVNGNWTVSFSTIGTGDLTISAINGTYSEMYDDDASTADDLSILELACGDFEILSKDELIENENLWFILMNNSKVKLGDLIGESIPIRSIYVEDYNCRETGYYTLGKLFKNVNSLEFKFDSVVKIINSDYGAFVEGFEIRDKDDNKLAVFDSFGNVKIKGNLRQNVSADGDDFIIEDVNNRLNLVVTNPEGNLYIDSLNENISALSPGPNSFVVKNKDEKVVAYVNGTGLFLAGTLTESVFFE